MRVVIDTNVFVAALLRTQSTPWRCVQFVAANGVFLFSISTWREFHEVVQRPALAKGIASVTRSDFIGLISAAVEWVTPTVSVAASRDPKDDRILEVAINGRADCIITGDKDLLVLHPYRGIPILISSLVLFNTALSSRMNFKRSRWIKRSAWRQQLRGTGIADGREAPCRFAALQQYAAAGDL